MIYFICNKYGERFRFYSVIIFGLVTVYLSSVITVWSSVVGLILVNCKVMSNNGNC